MLVSASSLARRSPLQRRRDHAGLIEWTFHPDPRPIEHVRVDHRGAHVAVPKEVLHGSDVVPALQKVGPQAIVAHPEGFDNGARLSVRIFTIVAAVRLRVNYPAKRKASVPPVPPFSAPPPPSSPAELQARKSASGLLKTAGK